MPYRYASLLRPLGSWISIDQEYSIEDPLGTDIDPFRPEWPAHNVLVTEEPLSKDKITSLQLTDISEMRKRKELCNTLEKMEIKTKSEYIKSLIIQELSDKIREGKIKNREVLDKMVKKNEKYAMGN